MLNFVCTMPYVLKKGEMLLQSKDEKGKTKVLLNSIHRQLLGLLTYL